MFAALVRGPACAAGFNPRGFSAHAWLDLEAAGLRVVSHNCKLGCLALYTCRLHKAIRQRAVFFSPNRACQVPKMPCLNAPFHGAPDGRGTCLL